MKLSVAAVIATYKRPRELTRLLASLAQIEEGLATVVVVDNAGDKEIEALVQRAPGGWHYLNPGSNVGCGGGLRLAEEHALGLGGEPLTHLLILDDDAVLSPGVLTALADAMHNLSANLACPLVTDENGCVGWLPGLTPRAARLGNIFQGTAEEFYGRFGYRFRPFIWAQGICLLAKREAVEKWGLHRGDFWVRGEDLEFSLRLTAHGPGILVPAVTVQHLPPPETNPVSREAEYLKHCALIQNNAFIGFRLPHGYRVAWTIVGALRLFFRAWSWAGLGDAWRALWRGAILGQPAGANGSGTFLGRFMALRRSP